MATGMIPQEVIDQIAACSDIVEIINDYVPLKKRGRNYLGLCPFHHEKTPSFSVSPDKQIFRCFGCGVGGNVFSFVMQKEGLDFPEAVEFLARKTGIALPTKELTEAEIKEAKQKERWYKINEAAAKYFHRLLIDTKWGKTGLEYLHKRGIKHDTIEKFQLGISLTDWDGLIKYFEKKGVKTNELLQLGLVLPRNSGGCYDRFRNRLMFPIWDNGGRVIAFGGRVLDDSEPKYLNSPDTPLFNKGLYLYGLHLAKGSIRSEDLGIIVEGYMDVIACHQYGVTNAVASLGTALTQQQGRALMRHTYQVAISYDGDNAGSNAALRGLDILSDLGCQVKVVDLPRGLDPDEYLRQHGKEKFLAAVNQGANLIEYKLAKVMENVNTVSMEGKFKVIQGILPDLYKIDSPVNRESAVKLISTALGLAEDSILAELRKFSREKQKIQVNKDINLEKRENNSIKLDKLNKVEIQMLKLLFEHQEYITDVENAGGESLFSPPLSELFRKIFEVYKRKSKVSGTDIEEKDSKLLAAVLMCELQIPNTKKMVADYIKILQINKLNKDYSETMRRLSEAEKTGDADQLNNLLAHIESILQQKKFLAP